MSEMVLQVRRSVPAATADGVPMNLRTTVLPRIGDYVGSELNSGFDSQFPVLRIVFEPYGAINVIVGPGEPPVTHG